MQRSVSIKCSRLCINSIGTSKGFGFVTFLDAEIATSVNLLSHIIDGRRVDCKKARPKDIFGD